jgi:transcriptional regulator with XRE-family HTH domain
MTTDEDPPNASPAVTKIGPASRPSVAIGMAVRRARAGRHTLAQLSEASGVSAGLLSLIERGRGNPSINTLGSIAEALGMSLPELVADAIDASGDRSRLVATLGAAAADESEGSSAVMASARAGQVVPAGAAEPGWRTSMVLHGGQEASVRVLDGSLELTLRDRADSLQGSPGERPLSIDLSLRSLTPAVPLQIPPIDDPRWLEFARGAIPFEPTTLACQMLFTHVVRCIRQDPSSPNVGRWVRELRGFFVKYESVSAPELSQIFG